MGQPRRHPAGGLTTPLLETVGLGKSYGEGATLVQALADVDLRVERGEFVGIMGPSGSGKSTLLHVVGGLEPPSAGEVYLDGQALSRLHDDDLTLLRRRKIGFVFQFFNLFSILSAEENVLLPLLLDDRDVTASRSRLEWLLARVGLTGRRHHRPRELSGGEQQRVAVARALLAEPALLLADEPTGNLDSRTGEEIMRLLRTSCDELGQTTLLVTHNPRDAAYADRLVFLKDGRIVDEARDAGRRLDPAAILARLDALKGPER